MISMIFVLSVFEMRLRTEASRKKVPERLVGCENKKSFDTTA